MFHEIQGQGCHWDLGMAYSQGLEHHRESRSSGSVSHRCCSLSLSLILFCLLTDYFFCFLVYMADNGNRKAPEIAVPAIKRAASWKQNLTTNSTFPVKGLIYPA